MESGLRKLGRNAFSTALVGAMGVGCTVVVDAVVVACFGLGWKTDAYFVASTLPLLLVTVLQLQAARVVQPLFIHAREKESEPSGWQVLDLTISTSAAIVLTLAVIGSVLSAWLVRLQSPGLEVQSAVMAARLSWVFFLLLPLYCPVGIMGAALNGLGSFALPGAAKLIESVSRLVFVICFHRQLGVFSLAWGTFAGVLIELVLFYGALRKRGYRFRLQLSFKHPLFSRSCRMMRYPLTAQLAGVGVEVANNMLGSMLGAGSISALRFATRIVDALAGLFANSIVTAAAPALTSDLSLGDTGKAKASLRQALHLLLLVTIPLSLWLAVMARPLITFLYQRKNFTSADVQLVAGLLVLMIPYIFLSRLLGLAELVFFGRCDTRTPFVGSMLIAIGYISTSLLWFSRLHLYALPVGRSSAYLLGSLVMLYLARRQMGDLGLRSLWQSTGRIVIASVVMAALTLVTLKVLETVPLHGFIGQAANLAVPSLAGGAGLLLALTVSGVIDGASWGALFGMRRLPGRT